MIGNNKEPTESVLDAESTNSSNSDLVLQPSDLLPGDLLLYLPRSPNVIQQRISSATGSPYTHSAIYLGSGLIAESGVPFGMTKSALTDSMQGNQCIAVLRSQLGLAVGGHAN